MTSVLAPLPVMMSPLPKSTFTVTSPKASLPVKSFAEQVSSGLAFDDLTPGYGVAMAAANKAMGVGLTKFPSGSREIPEIFG